MKDQEIIKIAKKDYQEFKKLLIENRELSLKELCQKFDGYDIDEDNGSAMFKHGIVHVAVIKNKVGWALEHVVEIDGLKYQMILEDYEELSLPKFGKFNLKAFSQQKREELESQVRLEKFIEDSLTTEYNHLLCGFSYVFKNTTDYAKPAESSNELIVYNIEWCKK